MSNRLVRISPLSITNNTSDSGAAFNQINVQPISGPGITGGVGDLAGVAIDMSETLYVTDYTKHCVYKIRKGDSTAYVFAGTYNVSGNADGSPGTGKMNGPFGIAVDNSGFLWVIDVGNAKLRRVDQNGRMFTVASIPVLAGQPGQITVDASGNVFYIDNHA